MPSLLLGYCPGSGFAPLISGNPWSGFRSEPIGGIQLLAGVQNSGFIYISMSGGNAFSGQFGTLVASGGPTINSGIMPLSGGSLSGGMDGMPMAPGGAYFIPKIGFPLSGVYNICIGADPACSGGFARVYFEML